MQTASGSDAHPLMKFVCLLIIITRALANITSPPHLFKNEKKKKKDVKEYTKCDTQLQVQKVIEDEGQTAWRKSCALLKSRSFLSAHI